MPKHMSQAKAVSSRLACSCEASRNRAGTKAQAEARGDQQQAAEQQQLPEKPQIAEVADHGIRPFGACCVVAPIEQVEDVLHAAHGRDADEQGQGDAQDAILQQTAQAAALPEQGTEEAAEQEEHRHAEAVHELHQVEVGQGPGVGGAGQHMLAKVAEGDGVEDGVQQDAQKYGAGAQGIQVVQAFHGGASSGRGERARLLHELGGEVVAAEGRDDVGALHLVAHGGQ